MTAWINKGVIYIKNIFRNGRFLTFNEIKAIYNINNTEFLNYHKIISSIPRSWKTVLIELGSEEILQTSFLINKVTSVVKPCKFLYQYQICKISKPIKAHDKWQIYLLQETLNWKQIPCDTF